MWIQMIDTCTQFNSYFSFSICPGAQVQVRFRCKYASASAAAAAVVNISRDHDMEVTTQ